MIGDLLTIALALALSASAALLVMGIEFGLDRWLPEDE